MSLPTLTADIGLSQIYISIVSYVVQYAPMWNVILEIIKHYKTHFYILSDVYHFSALIRRDQPKMTFIVKLKISRLSHIFVRRCLIHH